MWQIVKSKLWMSQSNPNLDESVFIEITHLWTQKLEE